MTLPSLLELPNAAERERAAQHVARAKREAANIPDVPSDTPLRSIRQVAVIGAGTMGGGIAMSLANIGIPGGHGRCGRGRSRPRPVTRAQPLCGQRVARQARPGRDGPADRAHPRLARHRRHRGCRPGHRGSVRGHGAQAGHLPPARCDREARRHPRHQHLGPGRRCHRGSHAAPAGCGRCAFLQPRPRAEAGRGGSRREDRAPT